MYRYGYTRGRSPSALVRHPCSSCYCLGKTHILFPVGVYASSSAALEVVRHVRAELGNTSALAEEQRGRLGDLESTGAWGNIAVEG
jgi:hypothetical protein